jgi:hypothetical protein
MFSGLVSPPDSVAATTVTEGEADGEPQAEPVSWTLSAEQYAIYAKAAREGVEPFAGSSDLEVQQRASEFYEILLAAEAAIPDPFAPPGPATQLVGLFAGDLNPVAPKAQKRVPVPEGLDLGEPFFKALEPVEEIPEPEANETEDGTSPVERKKPRKKGSKRRTSNGADDFDSYNRPETESEEDEEVVQQVSFY